MFTRTKVICTIGPAVASLDKMVQLIEAGMNVARINFSHGTHAEHLVTINLLRQAREKVGKPLAILMDTKGPEIRIGHIRDGSVSLEKGHRLMLLRTNAEGDEGQISVNPGIVLDDLKTGDRVLFDDGYISSTVIEICKEGVRVELENAGRLRSGKGVNIPGVALNLPAMTERDIDDIRFGCRNDIDILAASFIRSPEHVVAIKQLLADEGQSRIMVIAKIENQEGIDNFDGIVQMADGIMIARGDLGVEVPLSQVPRLQKMMIRRCYEAGKPSVTATQMLESMINNPRPTRAEASDVANAIYDSTSSVMLSGETAVGKYPLETLQVMKQIIAEAEADFDYKDFFSRHLQLSYHNVPSAVTVASVKTAYSSKAKAIFAFTSSGYTARKLARLRPRMPIIAGTHDAKSYHQLAFIWGVIPQICGVAKNMDEAFQQVSSIGLNEGVVRYGDLVVMTAGSPFGVGGTTNTMIVDNIGDVLARGTRGHGEAVSGEVCAILSAADGKSVNCHNRICLLMHCSFSYEKHIENCLGVLLQNSPGDVESELIAQKLCLQYGKPIIVGLEDVCGSIEAGQWITMDPKRALVYKGEAEEGEFPRIPDHAR